LTRVVSHDAGNNSIAGKKQLGRAVLEVTVAAVVRESDATANAIANSKALNIGSRRTGADYSLLLICSLICVHVTVNIVLNAVTVRLNCVVC